MNTPLWKIFDINSQLMPYEKFRFVVFHRMENLQFLVVSHQINES